MDAQVVHAMDKLGRPADKMRIKKVLEEFYRCVHCRCCICTSVLALTTVSLCLKLWIAYTWSALPDCC